MADDVTAVKGAAKRYSQEEIDAYYKKRYGIPFDAMTPEQRASADKLLESFSAPPVVAVNGKLEINPIRAKILGGGGVSPSQARLVALYGAYKSGSLPEQLDRERLKKGGVSDEHIDRVSKEREDEWSKGIETRFDQYANPILGEDKKKAVKSKPTMNFEPEVIEAKPKTDRGISKAQGKEGESVQPTMPNPQMAAAEPPPSAPVAGPGIPDAVAPVQLAPQQTLPDPNATKWKAQINQGGVMVPAQLVQEPN